MKNRVFFYCAVLICGLLVLNGCISVDRTPDPRFYMLKHREGNEFTQRIDVPAGMINLIGPVDIPLYLDRPQIVTQDDLGMMNIAQFDRWGESLDTAIARLVIEELNLMLPGGTLEMFPCNFAIPLNYQVLIEVLQLKANLKKDLLLVAQWSIINPNTRKMLFTKRSDLIQQIEPHNYSGLADALSEAVAVLSGEIARNLSILANQAKK